MIEKDKQLDLTSSSLAFQVTLLLESRSLKEFVFPGKKSKDFFFPFWRWEWKSSFYFSFGHKSKAEIFEVEWEFKGQNGRAIRNQY